jgi:hypothetical protein
VGALADEGATGGEDVVAHADADSPLMLAWVSCEVELLLAA